ncbi:Glutamine-binding periplasmic protein precursor [Stieleria neptunia]|uniref:Glutamine-binding periplasmic protein n=1 Tax=Stieleria neptunia TaxID=2527979 RepID=A0A518I1U0_9BACT|nr:transporter substrate-binding domain-containing protein [Stieleria neptunia]QDV47080.1 Glutamine-binding periplasmic protein precursor [Stieleria neptunia]
MNHIGRVCMIQLLVLGTLCCLGDIATAQPAAAQPAAEAQGSGPSIVVGTKHSPPFAIKNDDGTWSGISIELWKNLCTELDLEYEFREMTLEQILQGLERGDIDAGVAAISVTAERHQQMEFCHPHYSTGLGIAVARHHRSSVWASIRQIFSFRMVLFVVCMACVVALCGWLFWLFERKRNETVFGSGRRQGVSMGVWWSIVVLLGHKGVVPVSIWGRVLATISMLASIAVISLITGVVASALTVRELDIGIAQPSDLRHVQVATVASSTSTEYLRNRRIAFRAYPTPEDAVRAVETGKADAAVYDRALLRHLAMQKFHDQIDVLPVSFNLQEYAIALKRGSDLRRPLNEGLLRYRATDAWSDLLYRYLGDVQ